VYTTTTHRTRAEEDSTRRATEDSDSSRRAPQDSTRRAKEDSDSTRRAKEHSTRRAAEISYQEHGRFYQNSSS
jgi:hypothetical protein